MRKKSLNYDQIASQYNQRYQKGHRQGILNALRRILSDKSPDRVLEVGCGTCHWLERLQCVSCKRLGIDKSLGMLKKAPADQDWLLCQASAENLPLEDACYDFIFCVNAIHHFSKPELFILEAGRVLRPNGILAIIGMDPRDERNRWYIYDFFEGTFPRDLERFPDWMRVTGWLKEAQFENIQFLDVDFIHDPKSKDAVFQDPFLQKNACSQLALLSDREYQHGLAKLERHIQAITDPGFRFENDIVLSMLWAEKSCALHS